MVARWFTGPLVVEPAASAIAEGARPAGRTLFVEEGRIIQEKDG